MYREDIDSEDVDIQEFSDEIDQWIIDELKTILLHLLANFAQISGPFFARLSFQFFVLSVLVLLL